MPPSLKVAMVIPALKKAVDEHNFLNNFRPISNLKYISKLIERVILEQFENHMSGNKLMETMQSAYRKCVTTSSKRYTYING